MSHKSEQARNLSSFESYYILIDRWYVSVGSAVQVNHHTAPDTDIFSIDISHDRTRATAQTHTNILRRAYYIWPAGDEVIRNIICHRRSWWWWQVRSQKCQKIKLKTKKCRPFLISVCVRQYRAWLLLFYFIFLPKNYATIFYLPPSSIHIRWRWFMQIVAPPALRVTASKKNSSPMTSAAKSIGRREAQQLYKLLVTTQTTYIYTHTCTVYCL